MACSIRGSGMPDVRVRPSTGSSWRLIPGVRFWRVFRRQRQAVVALAILAAITAVVPVTARFIATDPQELSADVLAPPSPRHPLGTDYLGRDVLVRLLHGVTTSLSVGAAVAVTATTIGIVLGLLAGFYGGWIEHGIMRLADGL